MCPWLELNRNKIRREKRKAVNESILISLTAKRGDNRT